MSDLRTALDRFVSAGPAMGPAPAEVQQLRDDLAAIIRRNTRFFLVPFLGYAVLLVLVVVGFVVWRSEPVKVGAILAVAGVSIPFLIRGMQSMWSTKVQSEMLLALASTLDPGVLGAIAKTLLKNLAAFKQSA
jgi:hypothetical protein